MLEESIGTTSTQSHHTETKAFMVLKQNYKMNSKKNMQQTSWRQDSEKIKQVTNL